LRAGRTANNPTDTEAALLRLGKMQLEDWFAHNDRNPLDDSEFIPILDMLIESFDHAAVGAPLGQHLRRYACELYHQGCLEAAPETTFQASMQLSSQHNRITPASQIRTEHAPGAEELFHNQFSPSLPLNLPGSLLGRRRRHPIHSV
jgi:hypothetical protein